jgi:hypothetical protein
LALKSLFHHKIGKQKKMNTRKLVSFDRTIKKILRIFKAKGMERAKTVLSYEGMSPQDKVAYNRHIENRRVEMNVMDTLEIRTERKKAVRVAQNLLQLNLDYQTIAQVAELSVSDVEKIALGEDILDNYI